MKVQKRAAQPGCPFYWDYGVPRSGKLRNLNDRAQLIRGSLTVKVKESNLPASSPSLPAVLRYNFSANAIILPHRHSVPCKQSTVC